MLVDSLNVQVLLGPFKRLLCGHRKQAVVKFCKVGR
jgi:hypothetical protein